MSAKQMLEDRAKSWEAAKNAQDSANAAKRGMNTEEQAAWDAANADITRLDAATERQQRLDSLAALQTNGVINEPGREDVRTSEPSDASTPQDLDLAFRAWMRVQGERTPSKAEADAASASTSTSALASLSTACRRARWRSATCPP